MTFFEWFKQQEWIFSHPVFWIALLIFVILLRCTRHPHLQKKRVRHTMFGYTLLYADQKRNGRKQENFGKLLYSEKYDLRGKPDYIFRRICSRRIVPVELKSGSIGSDLLPHYGDYLQLCAYFLLLEDVYGVRPKYGWLKYRDYMFFIRNTKKVRKEVLRTMQDMRDMLNHGAKSPKGNFVKCRHCICNGTVCHALENQRNGEEA